MFYIFNSGDRVLRKFSRKYKIHSKGLFILAPSGSGKSYFVRHQKAPNWIDGDELWSATKAFPCANWYTKGKDFIFSVDKRCDIITEQAKKFGFWIIGASNFWLRPDAIVIPDWKINKKYIKAREDDNYDGGAKRKDFKQVLSHRRWLRQQAKKMQSPIFDTVEEAVAVLTRHIK